MRKTYCIDGKPVTVISTPGHYPVVFTIEVAGMPVPGSVEQTDMGTFLARDGDRRSLGTFAGLPRAIEQVVRAGQEQR